MTRHKRIGLFGGSFNPAHRGHLTVSHYCLNSLGLDEIWWLISPLNPLKDKKDIVDLDTRMQDARKIIDSPKIILNDIERRLSSPYTIDTVGYIKKHHPEDRFFWIMGADNFYHFDRWDRWEELMALIPMIIINRPSFETELSQCRAWQKFSDAYYAIEDKAKFLKAKSPAWLFCPDLKMDISSTKIRKKQR